MKSISRRHPDHDGNDAATSCEDSPTCIQRQLTIEACALFLVLSVAWPYYLITRNPFPWLPASVGIGVASFAIARLARAPWWWQLIHALFAPLVCVAQLLAIDPKWYLAALVLSSLVFRGAVGGRIPLFVTNRQTIEKLNEITHTYPNVRFLDLGAGTGSVVRNMATGNSNGQFSGVENAPITWLVGRLRTIAPHNCHWHYDSLWKTGLASYDVVYAFLSPAPMPAIWKKAIQEMRDGSLFISNSFPIPDVEPSAVIDVADRRRTRLFCYRISRS